LKIEILQVTVTTYTAVEQVVTELVQIVIQYYLNIHTHARTNSRL